MRLALPGSFLFDICHRRAIWTVADIQGEGMIWEWFATRPSCIYALVMPLALLGGQGGYSQEPSVAWVPPGPHPGALCSSVLAHRVTCGPHICSNWMI